MGAQPPALLTLVNNSIAGDVLLTWLRRGALPCTTGMTCFPPSAVPGRISAQTSLYHLSATALFPPKHTPPANTRAKKGAPPGALLSGKQLTIVLAAFTAVLQMSCRHLFLLPYLLSLRLSLLLWCQSPLLCQSEFLFRLLYQWISVSHLCMWLCR